MRVFRGVFNYQVIHPLNNRPYHKPSVMSDITEQQMDELLVTMGKSAGSLSKIADNMGGGGTRAAAGARLKDDLDKEKKSNSEAFKKHTTAVKQATSSAEAFQSTMVDGLRSFGKGSAFGFVAAEIVQWGSSTVKTWQSMTDVGQSFGGSMIKMQEAAADAGLPLDKFAKVMTKNNYVVGTLGVGAYTGLLKSIRITSEKFGMYGMTLDQMNEFAGGYLEVQRLAGTLDARNNKQTGKFINELALGASVMSEITKTSREEIAKRTQEALQDSRVVATMQLNSAKGLGAYNEAISK